MMLITMVVHPTLQLVLQTVLQLVLQEHFYFDIDTMKRDNIWKRKLNEFCVFPNFFVNPPPSNFMGYTNLEIVTKTNTFNDI